MWMGPRISPDIQLQNKGQAENQTFKSARNWSVGGKSLREHVSDLSEIDNDSQLTDAMGSLNIAQLLLC